MGWEIKADLLIYYSLPSPKTNQMKTKKRIAAVKIPMSDADYMLKKINLEYLKNIVRVFVNRITHIGSKNDKLNVYFLDGTFINCELTITEIFALLPEPQFVQCHESYIVNGKHCTSYANGDGGKLLINTKFIVPVSRQYKGVTIAAMRGNVN